MSETVAVCGPWRAFLFGTGTVDDPVAGILYLYNHALSSEQRKKGAWTLAEATPDEFRSDLLLYLLSGGMYTGQYGQQALYLRDDTALNEWLSSRSGKAAMRKALRAVGYVRPRK